MFSMQLLPTVQANAWEENKFYSLHQDCDHFFLLFVKISQHPLVNQPGSLFPRDENQRQDLNSKCKQPLLIFRCAMLPLPKFAIPVQCCHDVMQSLLIIPVHDSTNFDTRSHSCLSY